MPLTVLCWARMARFGLSLLSERTPGIFPDLTGERSPNQSGSM